MGVIAAEPLYHAQVWKYPTPTPLPPGISVILSFCLNRNILFPCVNLQGCVKCEHFTYPLINACLAVRGIKGLWHFRKKDQMPVII